MGKKRSERWITGRRRRAFLKALRDGASLDDAAKAGGHSVAGFCGLRRRDPVFARRWAATMTGSAEAERVIVRGNNGRRLQRRRMRHMRFDTARKEIFLNHFAGCGDAREAAAVAGVDHSTVYKHRRKDPVFAAGFAAALEQCYARLEVEAVSQRLKAQQRLSRALDEGVVTGEVPEEFERVMKLLDRWDRRSGGPGVRTVAPEKRPRLSFDEAIVLLERKLRNLDIPILQLPPAIAAPYEAGGSADDPGAEQEGGGAEGSGRGDDGKKGE